MDKVVEERMRELELAILSSENEPSGLKRISRNMQLVGQAIVQMMEEIMKDPEIRQREDWVAYLLPYIEYAVLLHRETNDQRTESTGAMSGTSVTYKGKVIDLVELGMGIWLSEDIHVDGQPAKQQFIKEAIEKMFGVPLVHWHMRVQELKSRKKDRLRKYNLIMRKLSHYLDHLPIDRARKKYL